MNKFWWIFPWAAAKDADRKYRTAIVQHEALMEEQERIRGYLSNQIEILRRQVAEGSKP